MQRIRSRKSVVRQYGPCTHTDRNFSDSVNACSHLTTAFALPSKFNANVDTEGIQTLYVRLHLRDH